jgi:integrase
VPKGEINPPTSEEVGRLLDAAERHADPLLALWEVAVLTGARSGELRGLKWVDLDLDAATLRIERTLAAVKAGVPTFEDPKTAKSRRTVDLSPDAVAAHRAHRDHQRFDRERFGDVNADLGLVFATERGTPRLATDISHRFKRALERAGVRQSVRFHDLRHYAISTMLANRVPVTTVSAMVGHHSPAMTLGVYGHYIPGEKASAAECLQAALRRARSG